MLQPGRLTDLLKFLEQIDEGRVQVPAFPGHVGRFLRQYERGRSDILQVLARDGLQPRSDGVLSGVGVGSIEVHTVDSIRVKTHDYLVGESGDALCLSEQLGGLIRLTLWLNAASARSAFNALNWHSCFRASGDYRWYAPGRVSTGESEISACVGRLDWRSARCLTAVADDLFRPPHAHEYLVDFRLGEPGIKYFRSICAIRDLGGWRALPGFGPSRPLHILRIAPAAAIAIGNAPLVKFLVYRQPWSEDWIVVDAMKATPDDVGGHAITWADFQLELGAPISEPSVVAAVREALREAGVVTTGLGSVNTNRSLLPAACSIQRYLRGMT